MRSRSISPTLSGEQLAVPDEQSPLPTPHNPELRIITTPPVGLRLAARYLRLRHLLPRYHTPVCHYIHACFRGEVKAGMSGFCGV